MGKVSMNDPAKSLFAILTQKMQQHGCILGIHASTIGQVRMNGDFIRDINDSSNIGMYHQLPSEMRELLVRYAVSTAPESAWGAQGCIGYASKCQAAEEGSI